MATAREPREAVLDDAGRASARGGAQAMLTAFKAKDYDGGLRAAIDQFVMLPGRGQGSKTLTFDGAVGAGAATPAQRPRHGEGVSSPAPAEKKSGGLLGGIGGCFGLLILGVVALVVIMLIRKLMGGNRNAGGYNRTAYDPNNPNAPQQGQPGYGQQGGGMGGFGRGMAGGVLGGLLGGYLGNRAFGSGQTPEDTGAAGVAGGAAGDPGQQPADPAAGDFSGDFGDAGGGDFSGDFGGGDSGGGDGGGGDF